MKESTCSVFVIVSLIVAKIRPKFGNQQKRSISFLRKLSTMIVGTSLKDRHNFDSIPLSLLMKSVKFVIGFLGQWNSYVRKLPCLFLIISLLKHLIILFWWYKETRRETKYMCSWSMKTVIWLSILPQRIRQVHVRQNRYLTCTIQDISQTNTEERSSANTLNYQLSLDQWGGINNIRIWHRNLTDNLQVLQRTKDRTNLKNGYGFQHTPCQKCC